MIVGTLNAKYNVNNNNKKVWTKEYILLDEKSIDIKNENKYSIKENIKINYDEYNEIINNFKKDYMLAVTSDLVVTMLVEVDGKYIPADKVFKTDNKMTVTIPLSERTININTNYKDVNSNEIITSQKIGRFSKFSMGRIRIKGNKNITVLYQFFY